MRPHRIHSRRVRHLIFGLALCLAIPCSVSQAQEGTPITSSGLNTTVSAPITLPSGETQFDITGGTRPGGGPNLYHSFGDFNVPNNNIANFPNDSGLATSNILGRVTEGNISNMTDTQITTSVSGGPQTVGGHITMDAKNVTLKNSQILSTATEGHGGAIGMRTHNLHRDASSVIDASSQSGTDGTVTITK